MPDSLIKAVNIDDRAVAARLSTEAAERLIGDFQPFLSSFAARYASNYEGSRRDDVYSVVMLAFYESIMSFDAKKGHFFPFAKRVMHARIVDHIRMVSRESTRTVSLDEDGPDWNPTQPAILEDASKQQYSADVMQSHLRDEIEQFVTELGSWGITLDSLSKQSPKHRKLRDSCRMAIKVAYNDSDIIHTIQLKHYFPTKAIAEKTGLSPKKIERARTFILASLIILLGDYEFLSEYVAR